MKQIRIGNDIRVQWTLLKDGKFFSLEDLDVTLYLKDLYGKKAIEEFSISGNIVSWTFYGKDQKHTGKYSLELTINEDKIGMVTTDICDFVNLVPYACKAGGSDNSGVYTETIELTSSLGLASIMIDDKLSTKSANPVQNKVVTAELNKKVSKTELDEKVSEINGSVALVDSKLEDKLGYSVIDVSFVELMNIYDGYLDRIQINRFEILEALEKDWILLIRYDQSCDGYFIVNGYVEDFIYLSFVIESKQVFLEIPLDDSVVYRDNIRIMDFAYGEELEETNNAVSEIQELVNDFNEDIGTLYHKVDEKPNKDEYVPTLSVGLADNLIGRGEATDAEFTFRATGGGSINDGDARIESIKGNSVVWNQMIDTFKFSYSLTNYEAEIESEGGKITITSKSSITGAMGNASNVQVPISQKLLLNHKYMIAFMIKTPSPAIQVLLGDTNYDRIYMQGNSISQCSVMRSVSENTSFAKDRLVIYFMANGGEFIEGDTVIVSSVKIYDLTKMFGAGYEPATMEEFYSLIPQNIDLDSYNEGECIHMQVEGIKSVGFNAWDEQWEVGGFDLTDGDEVGTTNQIRSKNFIEVLPNASYEVVKPDAHNGYVLFYDSDKSLISYKSFHSGAKVFTTPTNAAYIKFYMLYTYGTTYNNDICIHLVHSGYRNGQYEPYVEYNRNLSLLMSNFPDGMKRVPTACDEAYYDRIKNRLYMAKRIGEIDLGTLEWKAPYQGVFIADIVGMKNVLNTNVGLTERYAICKTANGSSMLNNAEDKVFITNGGAVGGGGSVAISDTAYSSYDKVSFKAAMNGVKLYYELAEPIVTELPYEGLNLTYQVSDFGTEKAIASKPTSAFRGGIVYAFNAVDMIRELKQMVATLTAKLNA